MDIKNPTVLFAFPMVEFLRTGCWLASQQLMSTSKMNNKLEISSTECWFYSVNGRILDFAVHRNVATFLNSYSCLPLPYATRQAAGAALQATPDAGVLFGVLMCGSKVSFFDWTFCDA